MNRQEKLNSITPEMLATLEKIVRRFDGFIAKYMGDGVLVYFGYPEAHEDDEITAGPALPSFRCGVGGSFVR